MKGKTSKSVTCLLLSSLFLANVPIQAFAQTKTIVSTNKSYSKIDYNEYLHIKSEIANLSNNVNKDTKGLGSLTGKIAKKLLIDNKQKVVRLLSKLPNGDEIATIFLDYFDDLINILDDVKDGVEGALRLFFKSVGFSYFWADLLADAIVTVISMLL